ncbi:hypothetical protein SDC9_154873 [bioreactor metagenome]|uniref:Uncharacterized protein n=1 Tax=bioreactor metagenome TaxID=1076179 RepID=A0A645F272_9ZZZZ
MPCCGIGRVLVVHLHGETGLAGAAGAIQQDDGDVQRFKLRKHGAVDIAIGKDAVQHIRTQHIRKR